MNKQIIILNIVIVLFSEYFYIPLILKRYLFIRIKGTLISLFKSELKIFPYSQMRMRAVNNRYLIVIREKIVLSITKSYKSLFSMK